MPSPTNVRPKPELPRPAAGALRRAWAVWFALLTVTFVALAATVFVVFGTPPEAAEPARERSWVWVIIGYYVVVVTAAFFGAWWLFRDYYRGGPVAPRTYLTGMSIVWAALAVGAWASLAVCAATRTLLPFLLAGVGNVMLLALWPRGNAMASRVGHSDDSGMYQEPH